jgi:hypothetical protein
MTRHSHLSDDQLAEVCLQSAPAETERQHLERCSLCEGRRVDLARLLADVTDAARADADAVFSPERLDRQQSLILSRIAQEMPHGRVISFPSGHGHPPELRRAHPNRRWIASAAAAGLVIGLLGGHFGQDLPGIGGSSPSHARQPLSATPLLAGAPVLSEEEFLSRLELAIDGAGGSALRPLHDLTPFVWEVTGP